MDSLKHRIQEDMKSALRAGETARLGTLRLLFNAIRLREINNRLSLLEDNAVIAVIESMIKQRKESIEAFEKGNRLELAEKEHQEIAVLTSYLPTPFSPDEVEAIVSQTIETVKPAGIKDMGRVMSELKTLLQGRADMSTVSTLVKTRLAAL